MKKASLFLVLFFAFTLLAKPSLYLSKSAYAKGEPIVVYFEDLPGNPNDWIGIYPKGSSNELTNAKDWSFTNGGEALNERGGIKEGGLIFGGINEKGEYEARLFLDNSYKEVDRVSFTVKDGVRDALEYENPIDKKIFSNGAVYYPSDLRENYPKPIIFFLSGWWTKSDKTYETMLKYISSLGYIVVFVKENERYDASVANIADEILEKSDILKYADSSKFGVVGHSSGGGKAFYLFNSLIKRGWGDEGKFIFSMAPWYAFEMRRSDFEKIPSSTNIVIQQYEKDFENDPRISLTIYSLLKSVPDRNKDYQIIKGADHYFPQGEGSLSEKEKVLRPLRALIKYTFDKDENFYDEALNKGSDRPYDIDFQRVLPSSNYDFGCAPLRENLKRAVEATDVDYCSIVH